MKKQDFRNIPQKTQDEIRERAVKAVLSGETQTHVAKIMGVSRSTVCIWCNKYKGLGKKSFKSKKRGNPQEPKLKGCQAATIVNIITDRHPEQLKLPFVLWTREAVRDLIKKKFNVEVSLSTVGRYLEKWGFTSQKPAKRAYERNDKAVKKWLDEDYPKIKERAVKEKAEIFWGDETGLRSDHQAGKTYSPKGKTPIVKISAKWLKSNVISALSNKGKLYFSVFEGKFNSTVFIDFVKRLLRQKKKGKIFLIVDNYRPHKSEEVKEFLKTCRGRLELFYLPPYAPELNPDELLNQELKANAFKSKRPQSKNELTLMVRNKLRSIQNNSQKIINYFKAENVKYAA
jgi:transposase